MLVQICIEQLNEKIICHLNTFIYEMKTLLPTIKICKNDNK